MEIKREIQSYVAVPEEIFDVEEWRNNCHNLLDHPGEYDTNYFYYSQVMALNIDDVRMVVAMVFIVHVVQYLDT